MYKKILCMSLLCCLISGCSLNFSTQQKFEDYDIDIGYSMDSVDDEKTEMINLTKEYFNRVFNIGDNYTPAYVDNNTSVADMQFYVKDNNIRSTVKDVTICELSVKDDSAIITAIVKADYSSKDIEADEYYISFEVTLSKSKTNNIDWTIEEANSLRMAKTSECIIKKDDVSGEIYFSRKE